MAFADELRKKNNEHGSVQATSKNMEQLVNSVVKDCIYGLKELCVSEAKKGKTGISGFLGAGYEEYATTPSAYVSERKFEPYKTKDGILHGLSDCGFSHLSAEVIAKPNYKKFLSSFLGRYKFSKSSDELHFIHITISWK